VYVRNPNKGMLDFSGAEIIINHIPHDVTIKVKELGGYEKSYSMFLVPLQ